MMTLSDWGGPPPVLRSPPYPQPLCVTRSSGPIPCCRRVSLDHSVSAKGPLSLNTRNFTLNRRPSVGCGGPRVLNAWALVPVGLSP